METLFTIIFFLIFWAVILGIFVGGPIMAIIYFVKKSQKGAAANALVEEAHKASGAIITKEVGKDQIAYWASNPHAMRYFMAIDDLHALREKLSMAGAGNEKRLVLLECAGLEKQLMLLFNLCEQHDQTCGELRAGPNLSPDKFYRFFTSLEVA